MKYVNCLYLSVVVQAISYLWNHSPNFQYNGLIIKLINLLTYIRLIPTK